MAEPITEFIGVYDADSTILGEIGYWLGARLGVRHCSLCDITHGLFTEKTDWKRCRESLSVPITTYHRNDAPSEILDAAEGNFPCVLARQNSCLEVVLDGAGLDDLGGSPSALIGALNRYLNTRML